MADQFRCFRLFFSSKQRAFLSLGLALGLSHFALACRVDTPSEDEFQDEDSIGAKDRDGSQDALDGRPQGIDTALPKFDIDQPKTEEELRNGMDVWVGHVIDGDTVSVWAGQSAHKVRLLGIDAPECDKDFENTPDGRRLVCVKDQEYYGLEAYRELVKMVEDKTLTLTCDVAPRAVCEKDQYDRWLAYLKTEDGDASVELARRGAAFSYVLFDASKRAEICEAEYEAITKKRGMWALGSVDAVLSRMNHDTRGWYRQMHDARCNAAMN